MIDVDMSGVEPQLIADYRCEVGEGPLWHPDEGALYWLDIPKGSIFKFTPKTGKHAAVYEGTGRQIGGMTIQEDGELLLFMDKGSVAIWREGRELEFVIDEIEAERDSRFNDVIADPAGRVFCGTMSTQSRGGNLYLLETDGTISVVLEGTQTANGMGFTGDRGGMYFTDSGTAEVYLFDYDQATGALANRRTFIHPPPAGDGKTDGMTVDAEDYVWSARWGGWILVRHAPDGSEDLRCTFPAKKISSVAFGGDDLTDLYITSAGGEDKKENGPGAGALFTLNLGIQGRPEFRSRIG